MPQTVLSVVMEVQPQSAGRLTGLIDAMEAAARNPAPGMPQYAVLKTQVPTVHFLSVTVFEDGQYDPLLVIEVNCDGPPGPFWAQMEAAYGPTLRDMIRCCKRPADERGILFDGVAAAGARRPVAPYLEAMTRRPMVFHQGNRGLDRDRVLRDAGLFLATRRVLAQAGPVTSPTDAERVHQALRGALMEEFPWLGQAAPARISGAEKAADLLHLLGFLGALVFCFSIPGLVLAPFSHPLALSLFLLVLAAFAGAMVWRLRAPLAGQAAPAPTGGLSLSRKREVTSLAHPVGFLIALAAFLILYAVLAAAILTFLVWPLTGGAPLGAVWHGTWRAVALSLFSLPFSALGILWWLRWLERRDSSQDAPPIPPDRLQEIAQREDRCVQNHMGSMVLVKPGVLRTVLALGGLHALGLVVRVVARDGYLGSMRTIHFAHWALVNNNSRLMFFSNFDGSWESYLDDFIEKAHGGLSLAWGNCTGFPPGRFLVMDGASHGRRFKAWARHSQAVSRFWYSAYPDLTVNQIERQAAIADGLRQATLTPAEATSWVRRL